ncbi:MAG: hypothetical protein RIQ33_851 [Bacteroidota bacterium]|jgi:cell division GTPase FtsZ
MNRKEFLKNTAMAAGLLLLPPSILFAKQKNENARKPIHFIGLGGAGCNAAMFIQNKMLSAKFTFITENKHHSKERLMQLGTFIPYQSHLKLHELNAKQFIEQGISATELKIFNQVFNKDETFILLVGLGHTTGTLLCKNFIDLLNKTKQDFYVVAIFPFYFEGQKPQQIANTFLHNYKHESRLTIIQNESVRKKFGDLTIDEAFKKIDEMMMNKALELVKKN